MKRVRAKTNRASSRLPRAGGLLDVSLISPRSFTGATESKPEQESSKHVWQSTLSHAVPPGLVCPANAPIDKHKHSIRLAQSSLIFIASTSHSDVSAKRLIRAADLAYNLRDLDTLQTISQALADHANYKPVAAYYFGLAKQRLGKGNLDRAQLLFEYAAESAPVEYRAKALLSIGAANGYQGNIEKELSCYARALNLEADYSTRIELNRAIAFNYTLAGDYHAALALLHRIAPMVKAIASINPRLYFDYLNNYAVNLQAIGRLKDALRLAAYVCRSPLSSIYHEWTETREEIEQAITEQEARAVIVAVPQARKANLPDLTKGGSKEHSDTLKQLAHFELSVLMPIIWQPSPDTIITIQSRLKYSFTPHAPPVRVGK